MNFKNKIKTNIFIFVIFIILGIIIAATGFLGIINGRLNNALFSIGIAYAVCGFIRIYRSIKLIKNEELMKQREIAAKDERNIWLSDRAKSYTFSFSLIFAAFAMIILFIAGKDTEATMLSYVICAQALIYYICYLFVRKKY